jgi:hypothetical protein
MAASRSRRLQLSHVVRCVASSMGGSDERVYARMFGDHRPARTRGGVRPPGEELRVELMRWRY